MAGVLVGANWRDIRPGRQPDAAAIDRAFAAVNVPATWGRWLGRARITRLPAESSLTLSSHDPYYWTRAVGVWAIPDTAFGREHVTYITERVRDAVLANLGGEAAGWASRPLQPWYPETNGAASWWASGQASQTRTRDPLGTVASLNEAAPEQADGPGEGGTTAGAAAAAAGETVVTVAEGARDAARSVLPSWAPWAMGAGLLLAAAVYFGQKSGRRVDRERGEIELNPVFPIVESELSEAVHANPSPLLLNPRPAIWDVAPPGTPYPCTSKEIGRKIKRGRFENFLVESCATPLALTDKQRARSSKEPRPERSYLIKRGGAPAVAVRSSVVREGLRADRGQVGAAPEGGADGIAAQVAAMRREVAEQREGGAFFPEAPGLPYPARPASSKCLPGSKPWRELEAATMERIAILEADGVPITRETLSAALAGDPAFREAADVQESCFRKWEQAAKAKAPQARLSSRRETALAREAAKAAGVDLSSAEYRDTLEGEQRAKLREGAARRRGGVRKAGGQNPTPRVEQALGMHDQWVWKKPGEERRALYEARQAFFESLSPSEQAEYNLEQARLHHLAKRDPQGARAQWSKYAAKNPSAIVEEALGMHWEWSQLPAGSEERATIGREKKRWLSRMTDEERAEYQRELAVFRKASKGEAPASVTRTRKSEELKADIAQELSLAEWHIHAPSWDFETREALDSARSIVGVGKVSVAEDTRGLSPSRESARLHLETAQRKQEALDELERGTGSAVRSFGWEVAKVRKYGGLPTEEEVRARREAEERRAVELEAALAARAAREAEAKRAAVVFETERRGRALAGQARLPGINPRRVRVVVRRA